MEQMYKSVEEEETREGGEEGGLWGGAMEGGD
jgi:hypothetical protein